LPTTWTQGITERPLRSLGAGLILVLAVALPSARSDTAARDQAAHRVDEQTLQRAGLKTDSPTLLQFFRERTLSPAEQDQLGEQVRRLGAAAYAVREQALAQLVRAGQRARPLLRDALKDPDPEIARRAALCLRRIAASPDLTLAPAAARLIGRARPAEAPEVLLAYLPFADDFVSEEVRHTLMAMALPQGHLDPVLVRALADRVPIKRAAAAEALVRTGAPAGRTAALPLLKDPEPSVRFQVALALVEAHEKAAVPVLIDLLARLPAEPCWQIKDLLERMAGEQAPDTVRGDLSPAKERDAWTAWWQKHQATMDLGRLNNPAALLGYTLVTEMEPRSGTGRVLEIDAGSKIRWQIAGLRYPVDAQLIGKDRVLIAEYLSRRVTERDFSGNILWERQVDLPTGCQRLPNGHTFIASHRQLLEVDRDGKEVFTYFQPGSSITAARKIRNGQVVMVSSGGICQWLDPTGKQLKQFTVGLVYTIGGNIDVLPGGRVLVPEYRRNKVVEYDSDGKTVWQADVQTPTSAVRLPNGHTLVATTLRQRIVELDRDGQEVWQFVTEGRPWRARRR